MNWILPLLALLPAVALCGYVYIMDYEESESGKLLFKLFALGAILCFPAALAESLIEEGILHNIFPTGIILHAEMGSNELLPRLYMMALHFLCVAPVEEGGKFLVLNLVTKRNKEFNCLFDGLIYSVFVSLGFATLENLLYVLSYGLKTAVVRAVLSVPGHMFFAVLMGLYYSLWHIVDKAAKAEKKMKARNLIGYKKPFNPKKFKMIAIFLPILAHGFYNTTCSAGTLLSELVNIVFVAFLYVHCFGIIRDMSDSDDYERKYVRYLLEKKYPELGEVEYSLGKYDDRDMDIEDFEENFEETIEEMIEEVLE